MPVIALASPHQAFAETVSPASVVLRALSIGDLSGDVRYSMALTESPQ